MATAGAGCRTKSAPAPKPGSRAAIDPVLNLTYWGTAQAKPWRRDLRGSGSGATNYANSTVALDADTGKLKWFYNHAPGESLDLDEVFERILIDHGDQQDADDDGQGRHPVEAGPHHRQVHRLAARRCTRT